MNGLGLILRTLSGYFDKSQAKRLVVAYSMYLAEGGRLRLRTILRDERRICELLQNQFPYHHRIMWDGVM